MPAKKLSREILQEAINQLAQSGTIAAAAAALDVPRTTMDHRVREAMRAGLSAGSSSQVYATSTLVRGTEEDGFALKWIKEKAAPQTREQIVDAIKEALGDIQPLPPIHWPAVTLQNLMAFYVWGDPHFGQYSWAEETGDDYDLNIAQKLHFDAVDRLVAATPAARTGVLVSVGDTTHGDDSSNQTPRSKHNLDVDTRWRKVLKVTVLTFERCIQRMLQRHEFVEVIVVPGNHDPHASAAIVIALACLYRDNPRVRIEESPSKFIYKRHGSCLIGITHGDTVKLKDLGEVMAADRPRDWGETDFHHWFTGHVHHEKRIEGRMWSAESFRTLTGKDAYAASSGYRSARDMQSIVFDDVDGEVGRHRVGIKALQRAA